MFLLTRLYIIIFICIIIKAEILKALTIEIFRDKSFLGQVGFIIIMQSSGEK